LESVHSVMLERINFSNIEGLSLKGHLVANHLFSIKFRAQNLEDGTGEALSVSANTITTPMIL